MVDEARSEEAVLAQVAERLSLRVGEEILEGGSSARVYRARRGDGAEVALKILVERPGVVDGHDLTSFQGKLAQIDRIAARAPGLAGRYAPVLDRLEGDCWAAHTTLWYESVDAAACLREGDGRDGVDTFFRQCTAILGELFVGGYGAASSPAPPDHLLRVNVGRFLRRFEMLERALPDDLVGRDELVVNGVRCRSPRSLLGELAGGRPDVSHLRPARLMLCAHGDANTRNLLVGPPVDGAVDFRIIDPRGSCDPWDPVYDLAKILFSLTVWDPALRLGFDVRAQSGRFDVGFATAVYPGYRQAIDGFLAFLARDGGLARLLEGDERWLERLLLTHDMHVLAEAPCRLSDPKPKFDCHGAPSSSERLAVGHYLLGTLLVNDLVEQITTTGSIDGARHLGVLAAASDGG